MRKLILGTVQFGLRYGINNQGGKPGDEALGELLDLAYAGGIRLLDTAHAYGDAIPRIGAYHAEREHRFGVISKFVKSPAAGGLATELQRSLQELRVDKLYAYLYHSEGEYFTADNRLEELRELKAAGLIDRIGVSIYTNEAFAHLIDEPAVDLIQLPYNLLDNYAQRGELLRRARAAGKELHSRSAFLQGLFFVPTDRLSPQLAPLAPQLEQLREKARTANLSVAHLALSYALANEELDGVLIGVDSADQLRTNLAASGGSLPAELRRGIDAMAVSNPQLLYPNNWI